LNTLNDGYTIVLQLLASSEEMVDVT
jgi:hypothetical protein